MPEIGQTILPDHVASIPLGQAARIPSCYFMDIASIELCTDIALR